jgi:broad specificity phosphatase PhoE
VRVHFLTHPEVTIEADVPVIDWSLSDRGRQRAVLANPALTGVRALFSSPEVKAEQAAHLIGQELGLELTLVGGLAELDRRSTGYLAEPDFWANYDEFLARPSHSARGWETAEDAQRRIVDTVRSLVAEVAGDPSVEVSQGEIALMSHGGVGALLLCHLNGTPIQRLVDQPGQGSYFSFDAADWSVLSGWQPFEELAADG